MEDKSKTSASSPRRWRHWTEQDARKVLADLKSSGWSVDRFARERNLSATRVRYWITRLAGEPEVRFVAVGQPPAAPTSIEIVVRGVIVRSNENVDEARLARVVSALMAALPSC